MPISRNSILACTTMLAGIFTAQAARADEAPASSPRQAMEACLAQAVEKQGPAGGKMETTQQGPDGSTIFSSFLTKNEDGQRSALSLTARIDDSGWHLTAERSITDAAGGVSLTQNSNKGSLVGDQSQASFQMRAKMEGPELTPADYRASAKLIKGAMNTFDKCLRRN